jgi:superfamily II helicase
MTLLENNKAEYDSNLMFNLLSYEKPICDRCKRKRILTRSIFAGIRSGSHQICEPCYQELEKRKSHIPLSLKDIVMACGTFEIGKIAQLLRKYDKKND